MKHAFVFIAALFLFAVCGCELFVIPKGGTLVITVQDSSGNPSSAVYNVEVYYNRFELIKKKSISGTKHGNILVSYDGEYWIWYKPASGGDWNKTIVNIEGGGYQSVVIKLGGGTP
ncbi:MAG: hypothetical protein LBC77_07855 [Spirochaetaceae bacterium]|jgi:hypothetical protein|nr:hypothetical protein [Spirochaetaceae bacterium]